MKNLRIIGIILAFATMTSCSDDNVAPVLEELSTEEIDDLKFLREEEKLARDVYLFSYEKYGDEIFNNISQSEQKHMDKVLGLLNTYSIADPASSAKGMFTNQVLQTLYNDLTAASSISLVEALKVGVAIEDLDIRDIALNEGRTIRADMLDVYAKLKCGSTNHMRSFNTKLIDNGATYTPQHITVEYYNEIINSANQQCGKQ